jgi:hypothetical protein
MNAGVRTGLSGLFTLQSKRNISLTNGLLRVTQLTEAYAIYRVYMPGETVINGTWKKPQMQAVAAR